MLSEIIAAIPDALRARIGALWIEPAPGGGWQARLSYSLMVSAYPGEEVEAGPYRIGADLEDLPAGVSATARVRYPDSTHPLDVWGDDPAPHVQHQIQQLQQSGLLGNLDWHDHGGCWLVKTHAGSDVERVAWVRSLSVHP
jgi:hypothetical protein